MVSYLGCTVVMYGLLGCVYCCCWLCSHSVQVGRNGLADPGNLSPSTMPHSMLTQASISKCAPSVTHRLLQATHTQALCCSKGERCTCSSPTNELAPHRLLSSIGSEHQDGLPLLCHALAATLLHPTWPRCTCLPLTMRQSMYIPISESLALTSSHIPCVRTQGRSATQQQQA